MSTLDDAVHEQERKNALATDPILKYFEHAHLPGPLREVSEPFCALAWRLVLGDGAVPRNPERTVALRKLLEAKDAAVRAALP